MDQFAEPGLKGVLAHLIEGCQIVDSDWRYVYINDAALEHAKRRREELLGRTMMEVYPGIESTEMFANLKRCMDERTSVRMKNRFTYPDGSNGHFEIRMAPVPEGVLILSLDTTELIHSREALEQSSSRAAQLERLEILGRLAGGVAHDFNNMLLVILTSAEIAMDDPSDPNSVEECLEQITHAAKKSAALTRSLLAFGRKQLLESRVTNLNRLTSGLEPLLQRLAGSNNDVQMVLADELPDVCIDPARFEHVLVNLVANARDAMLKGGRIRIATKSVYLDEASAERHPGSSFGQHVMLSVTDEGVGMDPDTRARIFEPFFTTKEQGKGTGLGLASVHGTVTQSRGTIWVYSEPDQGTTFKIYLPVADPELHAEPTEPKANPGTDIGNILVVDDEHMVRNLISDILTQAGYQVSTAASVREALALFRDPRNSFGLLITDVIMPGINGRELADELVSKQPNIRVLFVSGYAADTLQNHGVLQEGIAYLEKPFGRKELLGKIFEMFGTGPQPESS